jgi:hypothetical protein
MPDGTVDEKKGWEGVSISPGAVWHWYITTTRYRSRYITTRSLKSPKAHPAFTYRSISAKSPDLVS